MDIHQVAKKAKDLEKPNNKGNHYHNVEDSFDFVVHGNECIDNP